MGRLDLFRPAVLQNMTPQQALMVVVLASVQCDGQVASRGTRRRSRIRPRAVRFGLGGPRHELRSAEPLEILRHSGRAGPYRGVPGKPELISPRGDLP